MTEINYPEEINIKILFHQSITPKINIKKYYFINQLPRRGERFVEENEISHNQSTTPSGSNNETNHSIFYKPLTLSGSDNDILIPIFYKPLTLSGSGVIIVI